MSNKPSDTNAALTTFLDQLTILQKDRMERQAAEAARRAKLSPPEREALARKEAEERAAAKRAELEAEREKIRKRYRKMGRAVLGRESWTLSQFAWLLAAENPDDRGGWLDPETDAAAEERQRYQKVLESCLNVSLHPVNRDTDADSQRFATSALVELAIRKQLGHFAELEAVLHENGVLLPRGSSAGDLPASAGVQPAHSGTAVAGDSPVLTSATPATSAGVHPPNSTPNAPTAPVQPSKGAEREGWHGVASELAAAIMAGVSMREPKSSSPNKLRGSGKEFDELLRSICSQHDIDPPKSYEATRKHMLRLGYRFAGAQSVDGKVTKLLRAFAEAGGFSIG